MTVLLHLDSSVSGMDTSISRQLTALFAAKWQATNGTGEYRYRDLVAEPVPPVGAAYAALGQRVERHGVIPLHAVADLITDRAEQREWALTLPLINQLRGADTVLLGVPMYNFTIPSALKIWIDRVTFPGAFVDPETRGSVLRNTRLVIAITRGGGYGPGTPREAFDFQIPYLRSYFTNLGVSADNLYFVTAEMTRAADVPELRRFQDLGEASWRAARAALTDLAARDVARRIEQPMV